MLTQERLKTLLTYDPDTGIFRRRYATQKYEVGSEIGWTDRHGHSYVSVDGAKYRASRIAALYMSGILPPKALNHKDRNNSNDAWENLTAHRLPITQRRLKELLSYDPETGLFTWLVNKKGHRGIKAGDVAGCVGTNGYVHMTVDGVADYAHRLAWLYMTGKWPTGEVDHRDRNPSNNRWLNLRSATRRQNSCNMPGKKNRTNGHRGVRKNKYGTYEAVIGVGKKFPKYLGTFNTAKEAHEAYCRAAKKLHGDFYSTD